MDGLIPSGGKHSPTVSERDTAATAVSKRDTHTGQRLPLDKVLDILTKHDQGMLPTHIAREVGSDIRTVGAVLRQYRDRPTSARQLLTQSAVEATHHWLTAMRQASPKGNHQAAKDLLLHVGAIDPVYGAAGAGRGPAVAIQVVIGTPDQPIPHPLDNPKPIK